MRNQEHDDNIVAVSSHSVYDVLALPDDITGSRILDERPFFKYFPIPHDSGLRTIWDLTVALSLFYISISLPLVMGFFPDPPQTAKRMDYFVDSLFFLDIVINFLTDFENKDGECITDYRSIALNYIKTWFFIDLISTFPFEEIFKGRSLARMSKVAKGLRALKFMKMLRLGKIGRIIPKLQAEFNVKNASLSLMKYMLVIFYTGHWFGCFFFILSREGGFQDNSWTSIYLENLPDDLGPLKNRSWEVQYLASVYWSFTIMSTIGFGDIMPGSQIERIFVTLAELVGAAIFAYGISNMCTLVLNLDREGAHFCNLQDSIKRILEKRNISAPLRKKIKCYILHKYYRSNIELFGEFDVVGDPVFEKHKLLNQISGELKTLVCTEYTLMLFPNTPTLHAYGDFFSSRIACHLKGQLHGQDELIFLEGSYNNQIFFIENGSVDLIIEPSTNPLHSTIRATKVVIEAGCSFNDAAGVLKRKSTMSAFAASYVDIYSIPSKKYMNILYEQDPKSCKRLINSFTEHARSRINNKISISKLVQQLDRKDDTETSQIIKQVIEQLDLTLPEAIGYDEGQTKHQHPQLTPEIVMYHDHSKKYTKPDADYKFNPNHVRWSYLMKIDDPNYEEGYIKKDLTTLLPCSNSDLKQIKNDIKEIRKKMKHLLQSFKKYKNLLNDLHETLGFGPPPERYEPYVPKYPNIQPSFESIEWSSSDYRVQEEYNFSI